MTTQSRPIAMLCIMKYECPKEWATLVTTAISNVRYCNECGKNVTFCFNEAQLADLADQGECVAFVDARPKAIWTRPSRLAEHSR